MVSLNKYREVFGLQRIDWDENSESPLTFPVAYFRTAQDLSKNNILNQIRFGIIEGKTRAVASCAVMMCAAMGEKPNSPIEPGSLSSKYFEDFIPSRERRRQVNILRSIWNQRKSSRFLFDVNIPITVMCPIANESEGAFRMDSSELLRQLRLRSTMHQREKHKSSTKSLCGELATAVFEMDRLVRKKPRARESSGVEDDVFVTLGDDDPADLPYLDTDEFSKFIFDPVTETLEEIYDHMSDETRTTSRLPMVLTNNNMIFQCENAYPFSNKWAMDPSELNAVPIYILATRMAARAMNNGDDQWKDKEMFLVRNNLRWHNRTFAQKKQPSLDRGLKNCDYHDVENYAATLHRFASFVSDAVNSFLIQKNDLRLLAEAYECAEDTLVDPSPRDVLEELGE